MRDLEARSSKLSASDVALAFLLTPDPCVVCGRLTFGRMLQRHVDVAAGASQAVVGLHGDGLGRAVPLEAVRRRHGDALPDD